jgi:hypothetical protein
MGRETDPAKSLTVEHILPRSPAEEWKRFLNGSEDKLSDWCCRLGNLRLLTDINKEVGQRAFEHKKSFYEKSGLWTTSELSEYTLWDRDAVDRRRRRMAKAAAAVWRFE